MSQQILAVIAQNAIHQASRRSGVCAVAGRVGNTTQPLQDKAKVRQRLFRRAATEGETSNGIISAKIPGKAPLRVIIRVDHVWVRLIIAGSNGTLINIDPATGNFQSQTNAGAGVTIEPIVANSTLYVYDDAGRLHAYR